MFMYQEHSSPFYPPPPPLSVDKLKSEQIKNFWTIIHISSCVWVKLIWDQTICMCRKKGKIPDKKYCYICIYSRVFFFSFFEITLKICYTNTCTSSFIDHLIQCHCEMIIISLKAIVRYWSSHSRSLQDNDHLTKNLTSTTRCLHSEENIGTNFYLQLLTVL